MGRATALTFARGGLIVGCDVLFNLAGRSHFGLLENISDEDWDAARRRCPTQRTRRASSG
jgi:hypothetical protein